jgi:cell division protein FtsB
MYTHRVELEEKLVVLQHEREELEANVGRLADPHGIEGELRKRYSVGREGEEVIILVEEEVEEVPS